MEVLMEIDHTNIAEEASKPNLTTESIETENVSTNLNTVENSYRYPAFFTSKTLLELASSSWTRSLKAKENVQPYLRGCKWSPDGTCCLTVVNNDGVHVTELPRDLYGGNVLADRIIDVLDSVIHVKEAGMIYDFCWYPLMNSTLPETSCWITTRQNGPIQMWDAFDGSLRCSYRGFNSVDEMEPSISVTFNIDGNRIIAGYKKHLRTFDVNRPGRDCTEHRISSPASCLAVDSNLLAVGSWNTTVSLYNVTEMGTYKSIGKMHGHGGGVTHMKFTPDGLKLVTGARKDHRLLVWDIRYYRRPLNILSRVMSTNQRVYFDISLCGKYLVTGGTDGIIKVWDVDHVDWKNSLDSENMEGDNVTYKFPVHKDCCNSVSIHPYHPIIATGSGQHHYKDPADPLDDSSPDEPKHNLEQEMEIYKSQTRVDNNFRKDEASVDSNSLKDNKPTNGFDMKYSSYAENSLVFWWTGEVPDLT